METIQQLIESLDAEVQAVLDEEAAITANRAALTAARERALERLAALGPREEWEAKHPALHDLLKKVEAQLPPDQAWYTVTSTAAPLPPATAPAVLDPEDPKALLSYFGDTPTRLTEVQLKSGIPATRLSHLLSRLVEQKRLVRHKRGWYSIPSRLED